MLFRAAGGAEGGGAGAGRLRSVEDADSDRPWWMPLIAASGCGMARFVDVCT